MNGFFRSGLGSFVKSFSKATTPLYVSFGVVAAATITPQSDTTNKRNPLKSSIPSYAQEAHINFKNSHHDAQEIKLQRHLQKSKSAKENIYEYSQYTPVTNEETEIDTSSQSSQVTTTIMDEAAASIPIKQEEQQQQYKYLSRFIDHTVLKPMSSEASIRKMCQEAIDHDFYSVCCNPIWVSLCKEILKDTDVKICCVVGFPLGSNTSEIKALEAAKAVDHGADEIDMVMCIGYAKSDMWDAVRDDIAEVVSAVPDNVTVKVILETCLLTDQEIVHACRMAVQAGAKFVKTSTGFGGGGATIKHVKLMRHTVDEEALGHGMDVGSILVKASGGIRDTQKAKDMLKAGADRIGASSGVNIIGAHLEQTQNSDY